MKVFVADSCKHLSRSLARSGFVLGGYESYEFADGESGYRFNEAVKEEPVMLIASVLPQPGSLFELMVLHRLALENGARAILLVIPYLGYARQDRPSRPGEGSIGVLVARLLRNLRASRLLLIDVHSDVIRKALGRSAEELSALPLIAEAFSNRPPEVVIAPDRGSVARARKLAGLFRPRAETAVIDKVRARPNIAVARELHGEVWGKDALIVDDMIDTGGTLVEAVHLAFERGARNIRLAATHGVFSGEARTRLAALPVEQIWITNTLRQIRFPKIRVLDVVSLFSSLLQR